jgi:5-methyltetrahydrofolate--homocysteine methyltransferase|tara:strand:- start:2300 stop:3250 length:951 start_codon:yes stop_codon:yes gene_type:complete
LTKETFSQALENRILLFDGAMGTEIQKLDPKSEDFPDGKDGFNDGLSSSRPEWIKKIHRTYLEAGADCIETNTFGSNKIKLDEYGFGEQTVELNKKNTELARSVCDEFSDKQRFVVGSMGPTGYLPSSNDPDLGQKSLNEIRESFELQAEGLIQGTADALLIETSQDILEVKIAIEASHNAMKKTGRKVTLIGNVTLDKYGKMLLGTNIQSAYTTISEMGIDVFGLNCSTGPIEMESSIQWLDEQNHKPLLIIPNAGMPENVGGQAVYKMTPEKMAESLKSFLSEYPQISIIGGCCGTNPEHIHELRKVIDQQKKD